MVVYENVSVWIDKEKSFLKDAGDLHQFTYDTDNVEHVTNLQKLANYLKSTVYLIREFVAVDANYQDQHPKKSDKNWYLLEVKPE